MEIDPVTPDLIEIDTDMNEPICYTTSLMPYPYVGEELSEGRIREAMEQFVGNFYKRFSNYGPILSMGPLHEALTHSLFHPTKACPLILFIYHNESVSANIFCENVLCSKKIIDYLSEKFIVWAWDRTNEINYQRLLEMLRTNLGEAITETVASSPVDIYPLLICLTFNEGNISISMIIEGSTSHDEALNLLMKARNEFDFRDETPKKSNACLNPVANEGWSMEPSDLISINKTSDEYKRIVNEFLSSADRIDSIEKIDNPLWLSQYLNQKKKIYKLRNDDLIERLLIFPCSKTEAAEILRTGFNTNHKCIPGNKYGHGFYFLSPSVSGPAVKSFNSSLQNNYEPILICNVLVGRTCVCNWVTETCPDGYDSTTDGSHTYIVYSNRSIFPKYLIRYANN